MNRLTKKWINDGSETKQAKFNMVNTLIGFFLLLSVFCFFIKSTSVEYIDETGIIHENFYLIIIGYICLLAGIVVFLGIGTNSLSLSLKGTLNSLKDSYQKKIDY